MILATRDGKESEPSTTSSIQWSPPFRHIEFSEILRATENFKSSVIGSGSFGNVYRGNIISGTNLVVAAIKRLDRQSSQGATEFWAEVKMLSMLRHSNIVSLIGYCNHKNEKILVYEYMPNGTLDDHLHKRRTPLSWLRRLKICIDAGRGLRYLHNDTGIDSGVIHRDFKCSNILLHGSWTAKISDFGLSKTCPTNQPFTHVSTLIKGTYGYFDPDYYQSGMLTRKSDVYAFGVVMLEVMCRKRAVDRSLGEEQWGLVPWVQDSIKEGNLKHIIDSEIRSEISPKCLKEFVRIAERCLHNNPKRRPTMSNVVVSLENVLDLEERSNNSLRPIGTRTTIFGRMVDTLPFPSNRSVISRKGQTIIATSTVRAKEHGDGITVKRITAQNRQGCDGWLNFLEYLEYPYLIRLLGYYEDYRERLLIYKHMPIKILGRFLLTDESDTTKPLSWVMQLHKMIRVARGLTHLHSKKTIYHGLKSSDILLDEYFIAKIGGFGLVKYDPKTESHVTTAQCGTQGHIDPECIRTGHFTTKSDIYSFGVVLLEIITGRMVNDPNLPEEQQNLVAWATMIQYERDASEILNPRFKGRHPIKGISECFALALRCVANKPNDRPSSKEVLGSLEKILEI